jgi:D-alanyl-D-alanine carboxypeptidase
MENICSSLRSKYKKQIADLTKSVQQATEARDNYQQKYQAKEKLTNNLEQQVNKLTNSVGQISDYVNTDPEILKKYSRIYFLNENYKPAQLATIPNKYYFNKHKVMLLNANVLPYFENMTQSAQNANIQLEVISAYRSFGEQSSLKGQYVKTYGQNKADQFSADQGYSEHQLGTTLDLTTKDLGANFDKFDTTNAYRWMQNNAYKYGFILSYPKGNDYYEYEPWHWRFVGIALATDLHQAGEYFYKQCGLYFYRNISAHFINNFIDRKIGLHKKVLC